MPRHSVVLTDPRPYQGEAVVLSLVVLDDTGAAVDISSWAIQWRLSRVNGAPIYENLRTIDATVEAPAAASGGFEVEIPLTVTQRTPGAYVQEIRRVDAGFEETLARGLFTVQNSAFWAG